MILSRSPIAHLFFSGCPANIARLVISIIINTINGQFFRAWTHAYMIKKRLKIVLPFRAHSYSTATIVSVANMLGVTTTLLDIFPNSVFKRLPIFSWATTPAVGKGKCTSQFISQTSATSLSTACEAATINKAFLPAITFAMPFNSLWRVVATTYNNKSSESLSGHIYEIVSLHALSIT